MANEPQQQPYDNLLKRLVQNQAELILPQLFPAYVSRVIEELNIEILLPPRRTDRVYKSLSEEGDPIVLHVEFESSANAKMDKRLLIYHAVLLEKYDLPIISFIVYPFEVSMVVSPLTEKHRKREILNFNYQTFPLWDLDARSYVEAQVIPLYGLLPAMRGISDELLLLAIEQMVNYYHGNEGRLREELLCFQVLLNRAQRLPDVQLERVLRRIHMYDPLLEEDPWVKEKVAEGKVEAKAEGIAVGKAEGKLQNSRSIFIRIISKRFPSLVGVAEAKAERILQPEVFDLLIDQMVTVPDEQTALNLLEAYQVA